MGSIPTGSLLLRDRQEASLRGSSTCKADSFGTLLTNRADGQARTALKSMLMVATSTVSSQATKTSATMV